jgi:hypothetical protein
MEGDIDGAQTRQSAFADAGGVHEHGAVFQEVTAGCGRRVAALLVGDADFTDTDRCLGKECMHQATFADTALSGKDGTVASQGGLEGWAIIVVKEAVFGNGTEDRIAQRAISLAKTLGFGEVCLVDDQDGFYLGVVGYDQVAVDEAGFDEGIGDRGDNNQVINVGGDDLSQGDVVAINTFKLIAPW